MKRVQYSRLGDPAEVLDVVEAPSAPLQPGEVRVQVLATPIHPSNLLQIAGLYGVRPPLPATPGAEGVGRVVEAAEGAGLPVGQAVLLTSGVPTWVSEIVGPGRAFVPVPDGDLEQLSMLVVNPLTAWLMLTDIVQLEPGAWVIQSAANSAVGRALIQLAKRQGLRTVNVVRRDSLIPELEAIGADVVLVDGPDLAERVRTAAGAPMSLAIDAVGGETFARLLATLGKGGTIVPYGLMSGQLPTLDVGAAIFRDLRMRGFWLSQWFKEASPADRQAAIGGLLPLVASGALKMPVDSTFPLSRVREAVARAAEGGRDGKVLLVADPA